MLTASCATALGFSAMCIPVPFPGAFVFEAAMPTSSANFFVAFGLVSQMMNVSVSGIFARRFFAMG